MMKPIRLVNITRTIQITELSIPRDFASRATQTRREMFKMKIITGIIITPIIMAPQAAHAVSAFGGCLVVPKGGVGIFSGLKGSFTGVETFEPG